MLIKNDNQLPRKERNLAWKKANQESEVEFATLLAIEMEKRATPHTKAALIRKDVGV